MRQVSTEVLQDRKNKILNAVISHYIKTGLPVGSNVLIEEYDIPLSPATVRNLMSELEKEGYLTHPHTSAGRVPTDKGYRNYVNTLSNLQSLAIKEEKRIRQEYECKHSEIEKILSETSKILSELSRYAGFVTAPKTRIDEVKNIELVKIGENEILAIIIAESGIIKHKKIEINLESEQINELKNFLNEMLRGVSLAKVNETIVAHIRDFKKEKDNLLAAAEKISDIFYDIHEEIYMDGASKVIEIAAFDDFDSIRSIIQFNEQKEKFIEMLNKFDISGVNVGIGSENSISELRNLSLVTTVYKNAQRPVGVLGIIGPKRMQYDKMISLVEKVSQMLNDIFNK
ncbi:MAG: heat-inducible transcriptional repressor HrcA [Elusimicrobiota bacterium]|jgi:heat-inducible transcriptional repressor|nr:heat-inducible transcriptional repressor HrcA [Elusimicrobiota bacterium]